MEEKGDFKNKEFTDREIKHEIKLEEKEKIREHIRKLAGEDNP